MVEVSLITGSKGKSISPMQSGEYVIASSRCIEIPPICAVLRSSSSERTQRVVIGGEVYELPDEFVKAVEGWDNRSWVHQITSREAGKIIYKTAKDVNLSISDDKRWNLQRVP
jgi:hypothetical protein